jgi:hypothetical protein
MENLGKFTLFIIAMVCAFLTSLLCVKVIVSISDLYQIGFIGKFSFLQLYGIISLINIIRYKYKKEEEKQGDFTDVIKNTFTSVFSSVFFLLMSWGLSFMMYYVIS